MTTKLNAATRLRIEAASKIKKLKYGSELYIDDDCYLAFENSKFDFDRLEGVLNIFTKVPKKYIMNRVLNFDTLSDAVDGVDLALKSLPVTSISVMNKIFTKEFAKDYTSYLSDLQQAFNILQKVSNDLEIISNEE